MPKKDPKKINYARLNHFPADAIRTGGRNTLNETGNHITMETYHKSYVFSSCKQGVKIFVRAVRPGNYSVRL